MIVLCGLVAVGSVAVLFAVLFAVAIGIFYVFFSFAGRPTFAALFAEAETDFVFHLSPTVPSTTFFPYRMHKNRHGHNLSLLDIYHNLVHLYYIPHSKALPIHLEHSTSQCKVVSLEF